MKTGDYNSGHNHHILLLFKTFNGDQIRLQGTAGDQIHDRCDVTHLKSHLRGGVSTPVHRDTFSFEKRPVTGSTDGNSFSKQLRLTRYAAELRSSAGCGNHGFCSEHTTRECFNNERSVTYR